MSNAKRAIMVPVMTLAVCAIAMVGLGFALNTSVTSSNNNFEYYTIDISDSNSLTGIPTGTHVNGLFNMTLESETSNGSVIYTLNSNEAYIKAFSNAASAPSSNLYVTSGTDIGSGKNITSITMTLYDDTTPVAKATMTAGATDAIFKKTDNINPGDFSFICNKVYSLKITQITDKAGNTMDMGTPTSEGYVTTITDDTSLIFTFKATTV